MFNVSYSASLIFGSISNLWSVTSQFKPGACLYQKYQNSSRYMKMGYEEDFLRFLQQCWQDVERRIRRNHQRLQLTEEKNQKVCWWKIYCGASSWWLLMSYFHSGMYYSPGGVLFWDCGCFPAVIKVMCAAYNLVTAV